MKKQKILEKKKVILVCKRLETGQIHISTQSELQWRGLLCMKVNECVGMVQ